MDSRPDLISRVWTGRTARANADAYAKLLRAEILPGLAERVDGFRGGYVLRRVVEDEVEFVVLTMFDSLEAVQQFAGADYELAVVEPEARKLLTQADERASHYETSAIPGNAKAGA